MDEKNFSNAEEFWYAMQKLFRADLEVCGTIRTCTVSPLSNEPMEVI
jgi:hypothetical protein